MIVDLVEPLDLGARVGDADFVYCWRAPPKNCATGPSAMGGPPSDHVNSAAVRRVPEGEH
jgi:hypothetical protein